MYRSVRSILFIAALSSPLANEATADHEEARRLAQHEYALQRTSAKHNYDVARQSYLYTYERDREFLLEQRRHAARIDCPETRAAELRAINRQLSDLAVAFGRGNGRLADLYHADLRDMRQAYEARVAMINRSNFGPVVAARPGAFRHASGCHCAECAEPPPSFVAPGVSNNQRRLREADFGGYASDHPQFDWAGLVLTILNNRRGR